MRFPMLVLATAITALACEKGAPLSNSTANLEPAPAATSVAPAQQAGARALASSGPIASGGNPAAPSPAAALDAVPPSAGIPSVMALPNAAAPQPAASEEGDGEPMDDVDDEEVSATDKSGAGVVTHGETADEAPSGPVDDSDGADIELRE